MTEISLYKIPPTFISFSLQGTSKFGDSKANCILITTAPFGSIVNPRAICSHHTIFPAVNSCLILFSLLSLSCIGMDDKMWENSGGISDSSGLEI